MQIHIHVCAASIVILEGGSCVILSQGKGAYSYIGTGDGGQESIGQLRTRHPLDPQTGLSSLVITIVDTGEPTLCCSHK